MPLNYPLDQGKRTDGRERNNGSSSTNIYLTAVSTEADLKEYLEVSLTKQTDTGRHLRKTVLVFPGYEYQICFWDTDNGCVTKVRGLVDAISESTITLKYYNHRPFPPIPPFPPHPPHPFPHKDCESENGIREVTQGIPNCGCVFNKPKTEIYDGPNIAYIPVMNISDINYSGLAPSPCRPPKEMVKTVLLGISAEIVRAVSINLKLLEDNCDNAVKDIVLKVGNVYTVAYRDKKNHTTYEFDGKLISIIETNKECRDGNSIVRTPCDQVVGLGDSIYNSQDCGTCGMTDKDAYMESDGLKNDVLLTFDTSLTFTGDYENILLSQVRDVKLIEDHGDDPQPVPPGPHPHPGPGPCPPPPPPKTKIYYECGRTAVEIDVIKEDVKYKRPQMHESEHMPLKEVMDFYFEDQ